MTGKALRGFTLWVLAVLATVASIVGMFASDEWMQRLAVILLVVVGLIALTDWMRTTAK